MAADGSLKFDTKVDTGGFEDGVSTLDRAVKTLVKSSEAAGKRINDAFGKSIKLTELENQIAHTESQIVKLSDEMKQMGGENIPTEEYKQYSDLVSKTQVRLDKLMAQEQKMTEQSVSKRSSRWKIYNMILTRPGTHSLPIKRRCQILNPPDRHTRQEVIPQHIRRKQNPLTA